MAIDISKTRVTCAREFAHAALGRIMSHRLGCTVLGAPLLAAAIAKALQKRGAPDQGAIWCRMVQLFVPFFLGTSRDAKIGRP